VSLKTPLGRVRGLGSAKEGISHFWQQRVSSIALIPLVLWFALSVFSHARDDYIDARTWLSEPLTSILMLLLIFAGCHHMRLGLQVVIEDYVHTEGGRLALFVFNNLFSIGIGVASAFAILRIGLEV
jgi:succinate dehydrogenase / fumarate reductase membrane anchor subunit